MALETFVWLTDRSELTGGTPVATPGKYCFLVWHNRKVKKQNQSRYEEEKCGATSLVHAWGQFPVSYTNMGWKFPQWRGSHYSKSKEKTKLQIPFKIDTFTQ